MFYRRSLENFIVLWHADDIQLQGSRPLIWLIIHTTQEPVCIHIFGTLTAAISLLLTALI